MSPRAPAGEPSAVAGPSAAGRIEGYDLARAFAIFGMVIVNFKVVMTGVNWGQEGGGGFLGFATGLLEGRAAALFVILAGVGLTLGARRAVASGDAGALSAARRRLWKRSAALFFGGLAFSLIWPGDILHFYGWYLGLGALMLAWADRRLLSAAAGFAAGFVLLLLLFDYEAGWEFETLTYTDFWTAAGQVRHLFFNGLHPVFPWTAFLAFGLWLGRRDLRRAEVRRALLIRGAAVALCAESASWFWLRRWTAGASAEDAEILRALFGTEAMPPMPLYLLAAGGTAVAVIALSAGLSERFAGSAVHGALTAAGRLSLTIYVAQVLLGMGALEAAGRLEGQSLEFAVAMAALFYLSAVLFAALWTRRFRQGPLEAGLRRLSA